jgi:hypothetical protein
MEGRIEGGREVPASEARERRLRARGGHGATQDADARSTRQVTGIDVAGRSQMTKDLVVTELVRDIPVAAGAR